MATIFKLLPTECTPELNSRQRDTLLQNKEYEIPGGDSIETVKYSLGIDESHEYIRYDYYFTTGQRGFNTYEIRKFKTTDGNALIVFSSYGGATTTFDQTQIYGFKFKNKKLIKLPEHILPGDISIKAFFKPDTPDSIVKKASTYSNRYYSLSPEFNDTLKYSLSFEILNAEIDKYLIGDTIIFIWTGNSFTQGKITTSE